MGRPTARPRWPDAFLPPLQLSPAELAQLRQFERDWQTDFEAVFSKRERQMRIRPVVPLASPSPWLERFRHEMPGPAGDSLAAGWPINEWPMITRLEPPRAVNREAGGVASGTGSAGAGAGGAAGALGALRGWAAGAALLAALLLLFRLAERCLHWRLFKPRNRHGEAPPYNSQGDLEAALMLEASGSLRGDVDAPPPYNKATREDPPPPYSECGVEPAPPAPPATPAPDASTDDARPPHHHREADDGCDPKSNEQLV